MRAMKLHPKLWAQVYEGQIRYGPGRMPHHINGVLTSSMTDEEIADYGYVQVYVSFDDEYDPDVQATDTPEDFIDTQGRVVRKFYYSFQPDARRTMMDKINTYFDHLADDEERITPLLLTEWRVTEAEARRAVNDPSPSVSDYPMLSADIGVTVDSDGEVVETIEEAANVVLNKAARLRSLLKGWRHDRIAARQYVRSAGTDAEAFESYRAAVPPDIDAIYASMGM